MKRIVPLLGILRKHSRLSKADSCQHGTPGGINLQFGKGHLVSVKDKPAGSAVPVFPAVIHGIIIKAFCIILEIQLLSGKSQPLPCLLQGSHQRGVQKGNRHHDGFDLPDGVSHSQKPDAALQIMCHQFFRQILPAVDLYGTFCAADAQDPIDRKVSLMGSVELRLQTAVPYLFSRGFRQQGGKLIEVASCLYGNRDRFSFLPVKIADLGMAPADIQANDNISGFIHLALPPNPSARTAHRSFFPVSDILQPSLVIVRFLSVPGTPAWN